MKTLLLSLLVTANVAHAQSPSPANQMRAMLVNPETLAAEPEVPLSESEAGNPLRESKSRVTTTLASYERAILDRIGGRPFTAHQFLGFSGATYQNLAAFEKNFEASVTELNRATQERHGADAVTVLLLGGTVDGFGKGYDIIHRLRSEEKLKNVLVAGMASDQAVAYHADGLAKGWGDVISSRQDLLLVRDTFIDASGKKSWELKSAPHLESDTAKVLKDLSRHVNSRGTSFNVFGGGVQAFNETMELLLEARQRPQEAALNLHIGYLPGKVAKDTGYRASDMIAYVLAVRPTLLTNKVKVTVIKDHVKMSLGSYTNSVLHRGYLSLVAGARTRLAALREVPAAEVTPEITADFKFTEILTRLETMPNGEIDNFRRRSSEELAHARSRIADPAFAVTDPSGYDAFLNRIDTCVNCEADANRLHSCRATIAP